MVNISEGTFKAERKVGQALDIAIPSVDDGFTWIERAASNCAHLKEVIMRWKRTFRENVPKLTVVGGGGEVVEV